MEEMHRARRGGGWRLQARGAHTQASSTAGRPSTGHTPRLLPWRRQSSTGDFSLPLGTCHSVFLLTSPIPRLSEGPLSNTSLA